MSRFINTVRHATGILLCTVLVSAPLAALEKSPFAAPLAIGMNVSEPLIALNDLVQGTPRDSYRYRKDISLEVGIDHIVRDGGILVVVVAATVLMQASWKRRRARGRHGSRPKCNPAGRLH